MSEWVGGGWGVGMYMSRATGHQDVGGCWGVGGFWDEVLGVNRVCAGRVSRMWRNVPEAGRL